MNVLCTSLCYLHNKLDKSSDDAVLEIDEPIRDRQSPIATSRVVMISVPGNETRASLANCFSQILIAHIM